MSLPRDETPRLLPSPLHPTAALRGSHFASLCLLSRPARLEVKLPRQPRTYVPSWCIRVQPRSTGHGAPSRCQRSNADAAGDGRLLDFLATDLIFGVSEMAPPPRCARACTVRHLFVIA